jgi:hypothetical protein
VNDVALSELLRLSARLDCSQAFADAAARLSNWQEVPTTAEVNGLAPLLSYHLSQSGIAVPSETRHRLLALTFAHRSANRARFAVLGEILDAFTAAGIRAVVLKGAALAHLLYPNPGLRPLGDLDLLVDADLADRAQSTLGTLGFTAPPAGARTGSRTRRHHHLPIATKVCDGYDVRVEIHTDALSGDTPGSLTMERLTVAPQPFAIGDRTAYALGHADMLYHLCRHLAEPAVAGTLRLIWVADIVGYATRYREAIPWADVRRRYPFVINALSLLDLVTPLPSELAEFAAPPSAREIRGVGKVSKPPGEILRWSRPLRAILRDAFDPSDWWLRLYYGVGVGSPLWWHRSVRHPLQVGYWLARRTRTVIP